MRWSSVNAFVLVLAAFVSLKWNTPWPVLGIGSFSIFSFLTVGQKKLAGRDLWNWANGVSLFRWAGIGVLALAAPQARGFLIFGGGLLLMLLDSLDGWLAERLEIRTQFGEFLDKEIDSLFLLIICLSLASRGLVGSWVVIIGLSRYFFVIALFYLRPSQPKERRSLRGRLTYSSVVLILLGLFLPLPTPRLWVALGCAALLLFSFFQDIGHLFFGDHNG
ncbi:MAG: CDP-alcohol phosphatidyltransferase family protein [Acidobacteriota bacterium]